MEQFLKSKGNLLTFLNLSLLCIFFTGQLYAGKLDGNEKVGLQQSVQGTVTSSVNNMPIPGANVIEKGTTNGVVTDFDGNYEITVSGPDAILVFSFIGFRSQEVRAGTQNSINVSLVEDMGMLDEIVVVGYGTQKKI